MTITQSNASKVGRRHFLSFAGAYAAVMASASSACSQSARHAEPSIRTVAATKQAAAWIDEAMLRKGLDGPLLLGRFRDPVYYLLHATEWRPTVADPDTLPRVVVPAGFVTDLASIPTIFYSVLRPDGIYAHAAVIHDYMYWTQAHSRIAADLVFKRAMEYLEVSPGTVGGLVTYQIIRPPSGWQQLGRAIRNTPPMFSLPGPRPVLRPD